MAENNIDDIRQRYLRRPPVNHRRLENRSLDLEVPLEHSTTECLPLEAHETLGVGYGFDRLYALDLSQEQPVPVPLPSRHELMKIARDKKPANLAYGTIKGIFGGNGATSLAAVDNPHADFMDEGSLTKVFGAQRLAQITSYTEFEQLSKAFIGHGESGNTAKHARFGPTIATGGLGTVDSVHNQISLDPETLQQVLDSSGTVNDTVARSLQMFYNYLTPSAWEMTLSNRQIFTEIPKNLPYLDKAFYSLYNRDQLGAFKTKIRDADVLYTVLGMTEAMYAIRRGRFSKNITNTLDADNLLATSVEVMKGQEFINGVYQTGSSATAIGGGVINPFFLLFEGAKQKLLVAPWWLINKLNHSLYLDTDRDEEVRDVERKDITEMMTLMLEAMEVERGLHWGSESSLPMLLFDKFKEGDLPDFADFTNTKAALSASLLGYKSPRDAYYGERDNSIGRLPYWSDLPTTKGTLIGKERLEHMDRLKEMENNTILSPSPEKFKQGMQYTNAFDYTTMVSRTRFGDHSMGITIHPFGFYRGVKHGSDFKINNKALDALNLVFFPVYNWSQFYSQCNTRGLLPKGMNGAAYATGSHKSQTKEFQANTNTVGNDVLLWPDKYWRPGSDNYSCLLLASTDEMFQSWIDRGEQVRAEGATFPAVGPINLMAEMTYTTPMAMLQRNWPWLRKMSTFPAHSAEPDVTDTSFDYMTLGDDAFNMSVHSAGGTRTGIMPLSDRKLFEASEHPRSEGLQLLPFTLPLSKAPDNWVGVFQARDAMYFLTSMLSEPIMDAYTWNVSTGGKSNGLGSARLVIYQGSKNFEGRVNDVHCTPIIGVGQRWDHGTSSYVTDATYNDVTQTVKWTSVFPSASTMGSNATIHLHNYQVFLMSQSRIDAGTTVQARSAVNAAANDRILLGGLQDDGSPSHGDYIRVNGDITEDDFVPGLSWDKLWIANYPVDGSNNPVPYIHLFSYPYGFTTPATDVGITYLQSVGGAGAYPGFELGADANHDIDAWRMLHVKWIENVRVNLEYQRAAPSFYVFDKDCTDKTESYLRQSLFPLGLSTVGPLTYIGALGPEGQQTASETVTGPTVFELNSLTLGAGSLDESPSEPDDAEVGEENPSLHIAEKQDV
jgi:hypothetical protein